jgi:four helix bundle protein
MAEKRVFGHRKMVVWQNLDRIEASVRRDILKGVPKNKFQLRDQIDRSCSSAVANFIEGYYSGSIKEYFRFLFYSKRSLAELQDWLRRANYDGFVNKKLWQEIDDLSIKTLYLFNRLIFSLRAKISNPSKPS